MYFCHFQVFTSNLQQSVHCFAESSFVEVKDDLTISESVKLFNHYLTWLQIFNIIEFFHIWFLCYFFLRSSSTVPLFFLSALFKLLFFRLCLKYWCFYRSHFTCFPTRDALHSCSLHDHKHSLPASSILSGSYLVWTRSYWCAISTLTYPTPYLVATHSVYRARNMVVNQRLSLFIHKFEQQQVLKESAFWKPFKWDPSFYISLFHHGYLLNHPTFHHESDLKKSILAFLSKIFL